MRSLMFWCLNILIVHQVFTQQDSSGSLSLKYIAISHELSTFDKNFKSWNMTTLEGKILSDKYVLLPRISVAKRFGLTGWLIEQDLYKKFNKDYFLLNGGYSSSAINYHYKVGAEYFHPFAQDWEISMGLQFLSFHDTTRVLSPSISLSKYTGQFLTIGRFNMGLKNLSAPWNFYGGLQQRYYHSDQSYSAFSIGYGYDPDLTIFFNGIDLTEIRNKTFNLGLQTTQMLNSTWQMQLRGELQWLQFGTDRRKQANYFIKLFYYW